VKCSKRITESSGNFSLLQWEIVGQICLKGIPLIVFAILTSTAAVIKLEAVMFVASLCLVLLNSPQPHFINLLFRPKGTAFTVFLILDSHMELNETTDKFVLFFKFGSLFAEVLAAVVDAR
jgi:hypothetical protein